MDDFERPVIRVRFGNQVFKAAAKKSFCVEDGVGRVVSHHGLCSVPDDTTVACKRDIRRDHFTSQVVRDDFHTIVLKDSHT